MATADEYAQWIVNNKDKKGTPEFDIVATAYRDALSTKSEQKPAISTPEKPDLNAQFNQLPWYEKALIGTGKGMNDAYRGVASLVTDLPQKDKDIENSISQSGWGKAGEIAGNIAVAAPTAFIPGANTALGSTLIGAGTGALLNEGDIGERAQQAAIGGAGGFIGTQIPHAFEIARRALAPFGSQSTKERIAGDAIRAATGNDTDKARRLANLLRGGSGLVPGSQPTAAEIGQSGGLSALQRWAEQSMPEDFAFRRMSNADARKAAIQGIAKTPEYIADAVAKRNADAENLYSLANAKRIQGDVDLESLLQKPSLKEATARAKRLAAEKGKAIDFGDYVPESQVNTGLLDAKGNPITKTIPAQNKEYSVEGLHYRKLGLDDLLNNNADSSIGRNELSAIAGTKNDLLNWLDNAVPDYGQARQAYQEASRPINQMEIGQEFLNKANSALSNYGPMTRETAETFARALRDGDKLAAKVTGFKGAKLDKILEPEQLQTLNNVAEELNRKAMADDLGRGVGSNSFQNFNMDMLANTVGLPTWLKAGASAMPGLKGAVSGMKNAGNWLYSGADKEIKDILAQALLSPQSTADLIEKSITPSFTDKTLLPSARYLAPLLLVGAGNSL